MKICVVSDQAFPAWGGEGVVTQNLCIRLSRRGHEVLCLTTKVPHPPRVQEVKLRRFPGIFIPRKGHFGVALFNSVKSILREEQIQLVHINLPTFFGWQVLLAAQGLAIPRVLGLHVQPGNVIPPHFPFFFILEKGLEMWFSHFYRKGDVLISPSHLGKNILSRYCSRRIEVVSNGVDLCIFNPKSVSPERIRKFRQRFSLERDRPFLLYVGRLSREKNVGYLLTIMRILRRKKSKAKLLIVGEGEMRQRLQKRIKRENFDGKVVFTGFLSQEELFCAYREAGLFILPSFYELQSIVVLEAMAMGNAILVSDSSQNAARELVREGVNGYVFSLRDPEDAAEKIQRILSDSTLRESMQEASLNYAPMYDIGKSISRIEEIYRELVR